LSGSIFAENEETGLETNGAWDLTIKDNVFADVGMTIHGPTVYAWRHTVSNNALDGLPIGYFYNQSGVDIDASGYSQLILGNSTDTKVDSGLFTGMVQVGFSTGCSITESTFKGPSSGIMAEHSFLTTIDGNTLQGSLKSIQVVHSSNTTIQDNVIYEGIDIGVHFSSCANSTIVDNTVNSIVDTTSGVYGSGISVDSPHSLVERNYVYGCADAIQISGPGYSTVYNNSVHGNKYSGISTTGDNTTVSMNRLGWNNWAGSGDYALDFGVYNTWDGNSWSDYGGSGPYSIGGTAGAQDNNPTLLTDTTAPNITGPSDMELAPEYGEVEITWNVDEPAPATYRILKDGVKVASGAWVYDEYEIDLEDLAIGEYNYTIEFTDAASNVAVDSVVVSMSEPVTTTTTTTTDITTTTTTSPTPTDGELDMSTLALIGASAGLVILIGVVVVLRRGR
jgi:parallel beta-helix repeat protein